MKIVINSTYGGFGLSQVACEWLVQHGVELKQFPETSYKTGRREETGNILWDDFPFDREPEMRAHPLLVECVETLGSEVASGDCCKLKIVEIPDGVDYTIEEYDGAEWVAEKHRTWR